MSGTGGSGTGGFTAGGESSGPTGDGHGSFGVPGAGPVVPGGSDEQTQRLGLGSVPAVSPGAEAAVDLDCVSDSAGCGRSTVGSVVSRLGRRLSGAGAVIAVLLALLGFSLVVQLRTSSGDTSLATTRQEDLVRILSDMEAQEERLRQEIGALEDSQRQLNSGAAGLQAAVEEAARRADELGILAGTLPASGPGLRVRFGPGGKSVSAARILDAVQELRGAGAEAMQISGADGTTVRVVASTYFLDTDSGITVGGWRLTGPYTITVIGEPKTMRTALNIPGGVVASVTGDGGNVIVEEREEVEVPTLSAPVRLQHARPVS